MFTQEEVENKHGILTIRLIVAGVIGFACLFTAVVALLYFTGALSSPEQRVAEIVSRNPTFNLQQTTPRADASALTATQEALLQGYAWVDQANGVARIPIDRAMALLAATEETTPEASAEATESAPVSSEATAEATAESVTPTPEGP